ncbi:MULTISPECIES: hypothetical protein [unclassified Candidatus Frackibacter]|uniref:hypothetical protein n=1 Tax=unclassified Candidatus Frackibacter TaxID=2648818 RepID=UPI00088CADD4|nr:MULTISPECIES: hypothetical protein [unclassified Candidatus Frackibacter]SDC26281.1 hypothetical protein SAMN04515661_10522 [Candidatus Frackibacter sp. WG11]SEM53292.1 hypothetical protein SAMN04488698_10623 [Candidatus Frackibacter sp. WG12]SFL55227.1 hypothetical protein SAMN04488699_10572 [Candidatus Frackibacter sp. WG13]
MRKLGNLKTTAMGILPHQDIEQAMKLALSLDIPFWPQLPKLNYYEDMYVQFSENFPGMTVNEDDAKITLNTEEFYNQLPEFLAKSEDLDYFKLSKDYSVVYSQFLEKDLSNYAAIKGQIIGPISFGLQICDENRKPIIYNDEVRILLFDFTKQKLLAQYDDLKKENQDLTIHIDEPGLEMIFTSISGYTEDMAKEDMKKFLTEIKSEAGIPITIHLCGKPDWDFLLNSEIDILSFDAYSCGETVVKYDSLVEFMQSGKMIAWGIVPTKLEQLKKLDADKVIQQLEQLWDKLVEKGLDKRRIIAQSQLTPATCNITQGDYVKGVEEGFKLLTQVSNRLKERYLK